MRKQLVGRGAFGTKVSLADRRLRVAFDRNQFAILVINQLPAANATIWANGTRDFCVIETCMHRPRPVRHGLKAGAIFALEDLPNERPFRKQRKHIVHPVLRRWSDFQSLENVMLRRAEPAKTNPAGPQTLSCKAT